MRLARGSRNATSDSTHYRRFRKSGEPRTQAGDPALAIDEPSLGELTYMQPRGAVAPRPVLPATTPQPAPGAPKASLAERKCAKLKQPKLRADRLPPHGPRGHRHPPSSSDPPCLGHRGIARTAGVASTGAWLAVLARSEAKPVELAASLAQRASLGEREARRRAAPELCNPPASQLERLQSVRDEVVSEAPRTLFFDSGVNRSEIDDEATQSGLDRRDSH